MAAGRSRPRLGLPLPADLPWTGRARRLLAGEIPASTDVLIRTSLHSHIFGLHTDRYLASFDGLTDQRLHDLQEDPGATVKLRADRPEVYRELLGRMRAVLSGHQVTAAATYELSEQERKTLRSLGY